MKDREILRIEVSNGRACCMTARFLVRCNYCRRETYSKTPLKECKFCGRVLRAEFLRCPIHGWRRRDPVEEQLNSPTLFG